MQTRKNQGLFGKGLNEVKIMISVFSQVENIVGKGENAGNDIVFKKSFKVKIV